MTVTHDTFDETHLDEFWRFLAERQRVWVRRVKLCKPPPWTNNPILRGEHFTNVYRELDPGTVFVFRHFLNNSRLSRDEKAWHILNYRLTGSNRFVYRSVFPVHLTKWDPQQYSMLMHNAADAGIKVWGASYTVTGAVAKKGESKIDAIARVIDAYSHWKAWPQFWDRLNAAPDMHRAYGVIQDLYGFGPFLAYQSLIDMLYEAQDGSQVLPWGFNDWVMLGLGAKRGIKRLLAKPAKDLEVLQWLVDNQRQEFKRVGEKFPYLRNPDGTRKALTLQNFQTCLCEFFKYSRLWSQGASPSRTFRPQTKPIVPDYIMS